jgi:probable lipoprotein NlpC
MITEMFITDKYLGVPYVHLGRTLEGLDCYGLILSIYKDAGIELFDLDTYPKDWSLKGGNHFIENYSKEWKQVYTPKFLDVVGFKSSRGIFNHAGVMLDANRFINTCRAGTVIQDLYGKWGGMVVGYYRNLKLW